MYDATNTSPDLERSGVDTAVLPVGAVEQHGPHLPLSTDWAEAEAVGRGVAERLGAFLLPGIPYGNSQAHVGFRGSISLSPDILGEVVQEIVLSLIEQGFTRVVIINSHGGNLVLKLAVRELNLGQDECKVVLVNPWSEAADSISRILESAHEEQHAGEQETSMMMHLTPGRVRDIRIDHVPDVGPEYFDYTPMKDFCPDGIWGRPSLATEEKGRRVLEALIEATVAYVGVTFEKLGLDEG